MPARHWSSGVSAGCSGSVTEAVNGVTLLDRERGLVSLWRIGRLLPAHGQARCEPFRVYTGPETRPPPPARRDVAVPAVGSGR